MSIFRAKIGEIHDSDLLHFINELEAVCGIPAQEMLGMTFQNFLSICMHRDGVRRPFDSKTLAPGHLLLRTLESVEGTALHSLLNEIGMLFKGESAELHAKRKIYKFLNDMIPDHTKKKPQPKQYQSINGSFRK